MFVTFQLVLCSRESETLKTVGGKTSSALKRTGTAIRDTSSSVGSRLSDAASSLKVQQTINPATYCNVVFL